MDFLGGHLKSQMEPEAALKTLNTLRAASSGLSNVNYNNQTIHNNNQMKHSLVIFLRPETLFPLCAGPQHLLCPDQREKVKLLSIHDEYLASCTCTCAYDEVIIVHLASSVQSAQSPRKGVSVVGHSVDWVQISPM